MSGRDLSPAGYAAFESDALARGFDEVVERRWAAGAVLDTHTLPFAVEAVVIAGGRAEIGKARWRPVPPGQAALFAGCSRYTKNCATQQPRPSVHTTDRRLARSVMYAQMKPMRRTMKAEASASTVCWAAWCC